MNSELKFAAALCAVAVLGLGVNAMAAPKTGKKGKTQVELPDVVRASMNNVVPGSAITKITRETQDGVEVYQAQLTKNPVECEVAVAADGTLIAVETAIKEADLPQAVKDTLAKEAKGADILRVAKAEISAVTKDAKVTKLETPRAQYEVNVMPAAGKAVILEIAADGKLIKKEEVKKAQKPAKAGKKGNAAKKAAAGE
ncbi:MAG: hypothetical protein LLG01_03620 [Planctomycetaceae bacterium]|nr:hypothetical protein [Planctomycetaceae bacterium]